MTPTSWGLLYRISVRVKLSTDGSDMILEFLLRIGLYVLWSAYT